MDAQRKPLFSPGDRVMVYRTSRSKWFPGRVVEGPRLKGQGVKWKIAVDGETVDRWYSAVNLREEYVLVVDLGPDGALEIEREP